MIRHILGDLGATFLVLDEDEATGEGTLRTMKLPRATKSTSTKDHHNYSIADIGSGLAIGSFEKPLNASAPDSRLAARVRAAPSPEMLAAIDANVAEKVASRGTPRQVIRAAIAAYRAAVIQEPATQEVSIDDLPPSWGNGFTTSGE